MGKEFDPVKYKNDFNKETYDRISLLVPKGRKEVIKAKATSMGLSMNEFISLAIEEAMKK